MGALDQPRQDTRYRISTQQLEKMLAAGVIGEHERIELADGELRTMAPNGDLHAFVVQMLMAALYPLVKDPWRLRIQQPLVLTEHDKVQPDVCVLRPGGTSDRRRSPVAADVLLVIEVATDMRYDVNKIPRYAKALVPEVWIANLEAEQLWVYRNPAGDGFSDIQKLSAPARVSAALMPEFELDLAQTFGS